MMNAPGGLPPRFTPVSRRTYVFTGAALMVLKYALEAAIVYATTGRGWPLLVFLSPLSRMRADALPSDGSAILVGLAFVSLPFLFVGLSYSVRRAADAGVSPWWALGFLVPFVNFVTMAALSVLPTRSPAPDIASASSPRATATRSASLDASTLFRASALGIGSAVVLGALSSAAAGMYGAYGATLFVAVPVLMGMLVGSELNRDEDRGLATTLKAGLVAGTATALALLLFAIEGAICVLMVLPIALPLIVIGAAIGRQVAMAGGGRSGNIVACLALPLIALVEPRVTAVPLHHVVTSVEVDAPPAVVFDHVVSFPPIESERPWYFRTGIAVPLSARIEGHGVGAVRHCEFTTGPFVEPITHWEPGRRLAFDVIRSPAPMEEWSPYRHLHPAHLDTTMRSRRGEFRLVALPGGRTRLEGHTYYEMRLEPDPYFAMIGDMILHRVHERVLGHVATMAEHDPRVVR